MQNGFDLFFAACNHQRHLLIVFECLQSQLEGQKHGLSAQSNSLPEELMKQIVELSAQIATNMENFARLLLNDSTNMQSTSSHQEVEGACHELLCANLSVIKTALSVIRKYRYAPWATQALTHTAARTRSIQVLLDGQESTSIRHPT